jgi:hypothetical protein
VGAAGQRRLITLRSGQRLGVVRVALEIFLPEQVGLADDAEELASEAEYRHGAHLLLDSATYFSVVAEVTVTGSAVTISRTF